MTAYEILKKWCALGPDDYAGYRDDRRPRIQSVYALGRVLYNYGEHFPLAVYLGTEGSGAKRVKRYLLNGDRHPGGGRFGLATSHLQAELVRRLGAQPTCSFSALRTALGLGRWGGKMWLLRREHLVDWTAARTVPLLRRPKAGGGHEYRERGADYAPWTPPRQGMFVSRTAEDAPPVAPEYADWELGSWHILGGVLVRYNERYYLGAVDEGRYFVSELRRPARTVAAAFAQLKPRRVAALEAEGARVLRQGEYFLVPTGLDDQALAAALGTTKTALKRQVRVHAPVEIDRSRDNVHEATVLTLRPSSPLVRQFGARTLARGRLEHRARPRGRLERGPMTGEHRTVRLGNVWHAVFRNTERRSWGMTGNFD
jgi:hypothetical protein